MTDSGASESSVLNKSAKIWFLLAIACCAMSLSGDAQQNFRIVYFSELSDADQDNLQKLCFSLRDEYDGCSFELENFYEPEELRFDVSFGSEAFLSLNSRVRPKSSKAKKKLEKLTKPQFRALSMTEGVGVVPRNYNPTRENSNFEEAEIQSFGEDFVIWRVGQEGQWDWSKLSTKQNELFLEDYHFKQSNKKWVQGYQGMSQFYKGKTLLRKSFFRDLDETLERGSVQSDIVIIYANNKVESEFSCNKIADKQERRPDSFKIGHEYEELYSTTLRPNNGAYKLSLTQDPIHKVFENFELKVEVATGEFQGVVFEPVALSLGELSVPGYLSQNGGEYDLDLNVDWLGEQCLKVSGEEYGDPDCECREECLYQKHFYVSIRGASNDECGVEFPWSDRMRISFQCEK
jgi:hypothetical protein